MYAFSGTKYWRYSVGATTPDYSSGADITSGWQGLPADVDACLPWDNGKTYCFRGSIYYRYDNSAQKVDSGYPLSISVYWKGLPNDIDAALFHPETLKAYIFKGTQVYRYDKYLRKVEEGYPVLVSSFLGKSNSALNGLQSDIHIHILKELANVWSLDFIVITNLHNANLTLKNLRGVKMPPPQFFLITRERKRFFNEISAIPRL